MNEIYEGIRCRILSLSQFLGYPSPYQVLFDKHPKEHRHLLCMLQGPLLISHFDAFPNRYHLKVPHLASHTDPLVAARTMPGTGYGAEQMSMVARTNQHRRVSAFNASGHRGKTPNAQFMNAIGVAVLDRHYHCFCE